MIHFLRTSQSIGKQMKQKLLNSAAKEWTRLYASGA
ncbi:hypothetical protein OIU77_008994 [Salix suchowensis]|uniref:Uncharacterized protein n=1 Tax=Salix suchowensis TaxID=1278906 RepID=A0ABQ9ACU8_9ROSI|nr:hypothetical protein OIU77_008994 [Salix suchowensis]